VVGSRLLPVAPPRRGLASSYSSSTKHSTEIDRAGPLPLRRDPRASENSSPGSVQLYPRAFCSRRELRHDLNLPDASRSNLTAVPNALVVFWKGLGIKKV